MTRRTCHSCGTRGHPQQDCPTLGQAQPELVNPAVWQSNILQALGVSSVSRHASSQVDQLEPSYRDFMQELYDGCFSQESRIALPNAMSLDLSGPVVFRAVSNAIQKLIGDFKIVDASCSHLFGLYDAFHRLSKMHFAQVKYSKNSNGGHDWSNHFEEDNKVRTAIKQLVDPQYGTFTMLCRNFGSICGIMHCLLPNNTELAQWLVYMQTFCAQMTRQLRDMLTIMNRHFEGFLRHNPSWYTILAMVSAEKERYKAYLDGYIKTFRPQVLADVVGRVQEHDIMVKSKKMFSRDEDTGKLKETPEGPQEHWASQLPLKDGAKHRSALVSHPVNRNVLNWKVPAVSARFVLVPSLQEKLNVSSFGFNKIPAQSTAQGASGKRKRSDDDTPKPSAHRLKVRKTVDGALGAEAEGSPQPILGPKTLPLTTSSADTNVDGSCPTEAVATSRSPSAGSHASRQDTSLISAARVAKRKRVDTDISHHVSAARRRLNEGQEQKLSSPNPVQDKFAKATEGEMRSDTTVAPAQEQVDHTTNTSGSGTKPGIGFVGGSPSPKLELADTALKAKNIGHGALLEQQKQHTNGNKRKRESDSALDIDDGPKTKAIKVQHEIGGSKPTSRMLRPSRKSLGLEASTTNESQATNIVAMSEKQALPADTKVESKSVSQEAVHCIMPGLPGWVPPPSDSGYESLGSSTSSRPRSDSSSEPSPAVSPLWLSSPDPRLPSDNEQSHDSTTTSRPQHLPPAGPSSVTDSS